MKRTLLKIISLCLLSAFALGMLTACNKKEANYVKLTVKDLGVIVIELDRESAPKTVENFVKLVDKGFYDGLTFHRVIANFMVQGGCPEGTGRGNSGEYIEGEFFSNGYTGNHISHVRGVVSMARGNLKNSASCQFFICVGNATHLDGDYAAFGYVIEGMEVADAIVNRTAHLATDGNGGVPKSSQIVIEKAETLAEYTPKA